MIEILKDLGETHLKLATFDESRATDIERFLLRDNYAGPNEAACLGYAAQNTPYGVVATARGYLVSWGPEGGAFAVRVYKVPDPSPVPPAAKPRSTASRRKS